MNCYYKYHLDDWINDADLPLLFDLLTQLKNRYNAVQIDNAYMDEKIDEAIDDIRAYIKKVYLKTTGIELYKAPGNPRNAGRKSSLDAEQIEKIMDMYKQHYTQQEIADTIGISRSYVQKILSVKLHGTRSYSDLFAGFEI